MLSKLKNTRQINYTQNRTTKYAFYFLIFKIDASIASWLNISEFAKRISGCASILKFLHSCDRSINDLIFFLLNYYLTAAYTACILLNRESLLVHAENYIRLLRREKKNLRCNFTDRVKLLELRPSFFYFFFTITSFAIVESEGKKKKTFKAICRSFLNFDPEWLLLWETMKKMTNIAKQMFP